LPYIGIRGGLLLWLVVEVEAGDTGVGVRVGILVGEEGVALLGGRGTEPGVLHVG
jgi:hypothetical protein